MTKMHVCIRHIMAHKAKHCVQAYIQCEWRSERPSVVIYVTIDYEKLKCKENEILTAASPSDCWCLATTL